MIPAKFDYVRPSSLDDAVSALASGGEDGLVALWQPGKQEGAAALAKHGDAITLVLWSSDDQNLAIGTASGRVLIYTTA